MRIILDLISNFIEITGDSIVDNIILAIIGIISFSLSFGIVGMIFDFIGIYDSDIMSGCHWIVRIILFVLFSFFCIMIVKFIYFIFSFHWWIYLIFAVVTIGLIILIYVLKHKYSIKKFKKATKSIDTNAEKIESPLIVKDKNHCPRCGGLLVKRHGPYGDFYGCENYSKINCKYTRRIK